MERITEFMFGRYRLKPGYELDTLQGATAVVGRLAAYEDTGLEPEEVCGLCEMDSRARMANLLRLEEYQELGSIDHLRELVQRDRERVCGAQAVNHGMDITGEYDIDYDLICPSCGAVVGDAEYNELNGPFCHRCGQRMALPCEEAEAALT